jgi:uncharacterized protein YbjT (DUF2867 family)
VQRILIAGATGYLGKFLVQECKQRGHWVRALARDPRKLDSVKDFVDDIFVGEATKIETLRGLCDGIDIVISSLGVASSRTNENIPLEDVDYGGNSNILRLAVPAKVKKFIYVAFVKTPGFEHLEIMRIKEKFVKELRESGLQYCVMRPTAFFADMVEILKQARKGTVYLLGSGQNRSNAIHGADLAKVCVDAIESPETEIPVGGPEVFSHQEAAELAFRVLGKTPRIKKIPVWPFTFLLAVLRPFLSRRRFTLIQFLFAAFTTDAVVPKYGSHTLEQLFREAAERKG